MMGETEKQKAIRALFPSIASVLEPGGGQLAEQPSRQAGRPVGWDEPQAGAESPGSIIPGWEDEEGEQDTCVTPNDADLPSFQLCIIRAGTRMPQCAGEQRSALLCEGRAAGAVLAVGLQGTGQPGGPGVGQGGLQAPLPFAVAEDALGGGWGAAHGAAAGSAPPSCLVSGELG